MHITLRISKIGWYYPAFINLPKLGVMSSVSLWHFIHAWNYCVARGNDNNNHYCSCCISRYKGEYHRKMERSWKSTSFLDQIFTFKVAACFSFATNNKKKVIYSKPIWYQWIIHAKNVWWCGEGYFGKKKFAEKVRKSRQNVNRNKSA